MPPTLNPTETGLEVVDLDEVPGFAARRLHTHDAATQTEGLRRLAEAFVERPDTILQELVDTAVDMCGAESAGISLEDPIAPPDKRFHWIATAGRYTAFQNAVLPSYPSACSVTIERNRPQLFRVSQKFFDLMGVDAAIVTDGILIPWQESGTRGTFWIMSHERDEAFDTDDSRMLQLLSNFAAMAIRQQRQQKLLMQQARVAAAAEMANELAHKINNPLQSLTNVTYLAASGDGSNARELAQEMSVELARLTSLVKEILSLPAAFDASTGSEP